MVRTRSFCLPSASISASLSASLVAASLLVGTVRAADDVRAPLVRVLDASAVAWSAGDLDGFMDSYEDSPDTLFVGANGVVRGRSAIRAMYAPRFDPKKPAAPGALTFDVLEAKPLGTEHALLVGRFHLRADQPGQPEATGIFSLTFHRRDGRWRIVADHTS